jgi:hypothetical protein
LPDAAATIITDGASNETWINCADLRLLTTLPPASPLVKHARLQTAGTTAFNANRALQLFLRGVGAVDLLAAAAVVMPRWMMALLHAQLGLGELPQDIITGYLARSASLFCALTGALLIFAARDVIRNSALITWLARCGLVTGVVLLGIDIAEGLPWWWTCTEGPCCLCLSTVTLCLQWASSNARGPQMSSEGIV